MQYKIQPWAHQLDAISREEKVFLGHDMQRSCFALFFEMGSGKTGTVINMLRARMNAEKRLLKTLVLCPAIVIQNWKDEFELHSSIDPARIVLLTGSQTKRRKLFAENSSKGTIFVTNYEALLMDDLYADLNAWGLEALILDESHKCKNPSAKTTKRATRLALPLIGEKKQLIRPAPRYKYILSGTPVLNSPMDLFTQFMILDGGETFGKNFYAFRATYFYDKNAGMPRGKYFPDWNIRPGALDQLNSKIFEHGMRVEKKDCLDLPPLVRQTIKVDMLPGQAKMYAEMKKDFITFVNSAEGSLPVAAQLAITKALRLMQIASGYVKTVDGLDVSLEGTPKEKALEELLGEMTPHRKVIVWAVWRENYKTIRNVCERLGVEYVEINGDTPAGERAERVKTFNTDPKCRVYIGHPGSGGIGVNLTVSDICIFYSRNFSLEHSLQAEARNHRGGSEQHESITRIDLVVADTIDEEVQRALAGKIKISDQVLKQWVKNEKN